MLRDELDMPIAILLNTKGTAIRTDDEEIGETQGTFYANPNNLALVMQRKKKYMEKQFKGI